MDGGGGYVTAINALHTALFADVQRLVDFGQHERLTTAQYLQKYAGVKQVRLLDRVRRIGSGTSRESLGDAATTPVDLGKLHDIKAVFAACSANGSRGMSRATFIEKAASALCPTYPEGIATWYDGIDCDGAGYVNWSKLITALQDIDTFASASQPPPHQQPGAAYTMPSGTASPTSPSPRRDADGGDEPESLLRDQTVHGSAVALVVHVAKPVQGEAMDDDGIRRYCEMPRMSTRPANCSITRCVVDQSRRLLISAHEDGCVREFDLADEQLPIVRTIHFGDGTFVRDMAYCESRGQLLVTTSTGVLVAYDTTSALQTRYGSIIRAFQVSRVSESECSTPWMVRKTVPYDPHRMPRADVLGFSKKLDGRFAVVDVPVAYLAPPRTTVSTGAHVASSCCLAPELAPASATAHPDYLSPILVGSSGGYVSLFKHAFTGGMLPLDRSPSITPTLAWKPHKSTVSHIHCNISATAASVYSSSLDGTLALFDLRHEGFTWTITMPEMTYGAESGEQHPIMGFALSTHGLIATNSRSRLVHIWSTHSANRVQTLADHPVPVIDVAFNDMHNHVITLAEDDALRIFDVRSARLLQTIKRPTRLDKPSQSHATSGLSRPSSCVVVDTETNAIVATSCCPIVHDEALRVTKSGASGTSWPEDYTGHFEPVEFTIAARDVGMMLTADFRRIAVWSAKTGERQAAFVAVEDGQRITGLEAVAGRESVLVLSKQCVACWRYRRPRLIRRYVNFDPCNKEATPIAAIEVPTPSHIHRENMSTVVIATDTVVAIYFPSNSTLGSGSEAAVLHAVAVSPSSVVVPLKHSQDHKHAGAIGAIAPVFGGSGVALITTVGDVLLLNFGDSLRSPHIACCVDLSKLDTRVRLSTFDEAAVLARASPIVAAAKIDSSFRPSTGDLWRRALRVTETEERLGSAPFTRFKHANQQQLMRMMDFSVPLSAQHLLCFRNDGDAYIWSLREPTSQSRALGSWCHLVGCVPLTTELGACATGAAFCRVTQVLAVADTTGHMSLYRIHVDRLFHPHLAPPLDGSYASHLSLNLSSVQSLTQVASASYRSVAATASPLASQHSQTSHKSTEDADAVVYAVGSRQYVIPANAVKHLATFFMCRDVVNAIDAASPSAPASFVDNPAARFTVGAEGTQAAVLRYEEADRRLVVETTFGDSRQMLEPALVEEHRFLWLLEAHSRQAARQATAAGAAKAAASITPLVRRAASAAPTPVNRALGSPSSSPPSAVVSGSLSSSPSQLSPLQGGLFGAAVGAPLPIPAEQAPAPRVAVRTGSPARDGDEALRQILERRPYIARAMSARPTAVRGSASSAAGGGAVSNVAVEFLRRAMRAEATEMNDVKRVSATSYRQLVLPKVAQFTADANPAGSKPGASSRRKL
jgi:WD40 repeat protein